MKTISALQLIIDAHRLLGLNISGDSLGTSPVNDSLTALNAMLDSWSTEGLSIFHSLDQAFYWPANRASRTLGPSDAANFTGTRPTKLSSATYFIDEDFGTSQQPRQLTKEEYAAISSKTLTSTYPNAFYANMTMPDIVISVYPIPTKGLRWHFISDGPLDSNLELGSSLQFPPGYYRAIRYNLAIDLAAEFGQNVSASVVRIAIEAKRGIERVNNCPNVLAIPCA